MALHFLLAHPTISCHLAVLRGPDLVRSDRAGQYVVDSLNPRAMLPALLQLISARPPRVDRDLLRGRNDTAPSGRGAPAASAGRAGSGPGARAAAPAGPRSG